jgi:hypothetical protein
VRRIASNGQLSTVAGTGDNPQGAPGAFSGEGGPATQATLGLPGDLIALPDGGFLFSDAAQGTIRAVSAHGIITTLVGSDRHHARYDDTAPRPPPSYRAFGEGSRADGVLLAQPEAIALTSDGGLLIGDPVLQAVRYVTSQRPLRLAIALRSAREHDGRLVVTYRSTGWASVLLRAVQNGTTVARQRTTAHVGLNRVVLREHVPAGGFRLVLAATDAHHRVAGSCTRDPAKP